MRLAGILFSVLLGCSRTTLELPEPQESSSLEPGGCPSANSWVVSPPVVLAPGTPSEAALGAFDLAVNGEVTAIAHTVANNGRPFDVVRFLTGDALASRWRGVSSRARRRSLSR